MVNLKITVCISKTNSGASVRQRTRPPLWSSGQSSWLQIQMSQVRFPALPHFLRSSGSGTGSTQLLEDNCGATCKDSSGCGLENRNQRPSGFVALTTRHPLSAKVGTNFADNRQSLGRYAYHEQ
jgi:hypothetical protein